jgi:non-heme Fe2+,alpha-ketoglutarate-dependent halogenase
MVGRGRADGLGIRSRAAAGKRAGTECTIDFPWAGEGLDAMTLMTDLGRRYAVDGYVANIRVADDATVLRYRRQFDEVEAREGRVKCQRGLYDPHFTIPFVWELASNPHVLDAVEAVIGPDILVMASHFFCKYGPTEAFVAWHQDLTYWGLAPAVAVSAWYAVDDSDEGNGCLQVIPGTHTGGIRAHGTSPDPTANLLSINQQVPVTPEEERRVVNVQLKAGEISLHDGLLVHGSRPNRSLRRRCGLATVYIPTSVRQAGDNSHGTRWRAVLVRGENRGQHFQDVPPPFAAG